MALAASGLVRVGVAAGGAATPLGILLTLLAALSWAVSNLAVKRAGKVNMMAYVIRASIFAALPLLICSLLIEGGALMAQGMRAAVAGTGAAVIWQSVGTTIFGNGVGSGQFGRAG